MRSKEKILQDVAMLTSLAFAAKFEGRNCLTIIEAKAAMDEYAKEMAIEFAGWLLSNPDYFDLRLEPISLFNQFLQEISSPIKTSHQ